MFKFYCSHTSLTDDRNAPIVKSGLFRSVVEEYRRDNFPVVFKPLRTDVCDLCKFLDAAIESTHDLASRARLEQVRKDHVSRASLGYQLVHELYELAKLVDSATNAPFCAVLEYDYLKTLVYPILAEEPTHKYRATHKSLYRFGVNFAGQDESVVYFWDSQESKKVFCFLE